MNRCGNAYRCINVGMQAQADELGLFLQQQLTLFWSRNYCTIHKGGAIAQTTAANAEYLSAPENWQL